MGLFEQRYPEQEEMERKIRSLRSAGMTNSADRIEKQLKLFLHKRGGNAEKVKPMTQQELVKSIKQQKALSGKA
jgi:hypothetical protein